mmetsp:Transcript_25065/g.34981  ORF Transcript_25065/g.34981 Transcript_25065/m.34981 type:complete len:140 (-) Transcript_25065:101-520(-)
MNFIRFAKINTLYTNCKKSTKIKKNTCLYYISTSILDILINLINKLKEKRCINSYNLYINSYRRFLNINFFKREIKNYYLSWSTRFNLLNKARKIKFINPAITNRGISFKILCVQYTSKMKTLCGLFKIFEKRLLFNKY